MIEPFKDIEDARALAQAIVDTVRKPLLVLDGDFCVLAVSRSYYLTFRVVGAHAVLYHRKPHEDALRSWAKKLMQTKPFKLVAVALANKMARIAFAIMRGRTTYSAAPV